MLGGEGGLAGYLVQVRLQDSGKGFGLGNSHICKGDDTVRARVRRCGYTLWWMGLREQVGGGATLLRVVLKPVVCMGGAREAGS